MSFPASDSDLANAMAKLSAEDLESFKAFLASNGKISAESLIEKARIRQLADPEQAAVEAEVFGKAGESGANDLLDATLAHAICTDVRHLAELARIG